MTGLVYLKDVSTLKVNTKECTGCGMCLDVCPHAVFGMENRKVEIKAPDRCMECGACMQNCPQGAISVNPGVGCAAAVISGLINKSEPVCGCGEGSSSKGCC